MPTPGPVAKLCWGRIDFEYNGHGCHEMFDYLEPNPTASLTSIEVLAGIHNKLTLFRGSSLPKNVEIIDARVGYYGKPPDSCDSLWGVVGPLKTGSTYKFAEPDNMKNSASFNLTTLGGARSSYWMRFMEDDACIDNLFQQQPVGIITKPAIAPVQPVYSDAKDQIIKRIIEAIMFWTVQGKPNPDLLLDPIPPGTLPFVYDDWRRCSFNKVTTRKIGKSKRLERGRAANYSR